MKKSFIKLLGVTSIAVILAGCASKQNASSTEATIYEHTPPNRELASVIDRQKAKRVLRNQQFDNIGYILKDGKPYCSGAILKHGVFLTAKHCFSGRQFGGEGLKHFSLAFITKNDTPENPFIVSSDNLVRIFPDEGFNDIAYILYKPESTRSVDLAVNATDFLNFEEDLTSLMLIGFPKVTLPYPQKISSEQCSLAEMAGRYRKYPKSLHYKGELFDTTCPAYYGNSGGPALGVRVVPTDNGLSAKVSLVGVVAHTFNDEANLQKDEFGAFVDNANISPLRDAKNLNTVLSLDIPNLSDSNFLGNKKIALNTPELKVSDWLTQQKDFPSLFYSEKSFWKKPKDLTNISKKRQELENSYGNSQVKCPQETNRVQSVFNNIISKNNLSKYLEGDNNLRIFVDCENNGLDAGTWYGSLKISKGMIKSLKADGALSCLVAHELSHHLLKHDQIVRNEIFISRKELDADALGAALTLQAGYTKADCGTFLTFAAVLDGGIAGSEDPYPTSYERMQNLKDLIIRK
jgi:hypothetical protein